MSTNQAVKVGVWRAVVLDLLLLVAAAATVVVQMVRRVKHRLCD